METLKNKVHNLPLQKAFVLAVVGTMLFVVSVSAATIWGLLSLRRFLLPESDLVYLTVEYAYKDGTKSQVDTLVHIGEEGQEKLEPFSYVAIDAGEGIDMPQVENFGITKVENSYTALTPKRKMVYIVAGAAMILLPLFYSLVGILFCGYRFYRRKLAEPIRLLSEASDNIMEQNLDFHIQYDNEDEMGRLCKSYEKMRQRLYENYKKLWQALEDRKLLQASVAHDLRNPIAIIEGYTEYLQIHLTDNKISGEELIKIVGNIDAAAGRLEHYTESVRELNHLEEIEVRKEPVVIKEYLAKLETDFLILAEHKNIRLITEEPHVQEDVKETVSLDAQVVYRIIENILQNAFRFAKTTVTIFASVKPEQLCIQICDDGPGFSPQMLSGEGYSINTKEQDGHMGIGIAMSRILCRKHGGQIDLANQFGGACVKIIIGL